MMEVGPCGPLRYPEHRADLGVLESLDVVKNDHRPLAVGQPGERIAQPVAQVVGLAGIPEGRGHRSGQLLRGAPFRRRIRSSAALATIRWSQAPKAWSGRKRSRALYEC